MSTDDQVSRTHLPIPSAPRTGLITYDAKDPDTPHPPIRDVRPPDGAPNILLILLDDVGFGAASAFGGPCATPTAEQLAAGGLKYNRFHTTALCSPTRQALLTGRNHHSAGMGGITEIATGQPGYSSVLPNTMSPIARTLKLNGYSTAQFGKCHEVPVWQTSPVGPFDAWPSAGGGFEYFYGFIGGEANQWYPSLYEGTNPVEVDRTPEQGYHLMEDMTDKAIGWIGQQKALAPDKPFFTYFAPGATHAPHHAPKEWIDKYKGKFDAGWDVLREQTFARQKELGVIPADAQLTPRPEQIPAWDDMPEDLKPVLRRQMEVYAGFLEYTDHHVGRLIDSIDKLGLLEDTLIYYIVGDNGASAEGTLNGTFNEMLNFNLLEAAGIPAPLFVNGVAQAPIEGWPRAGRRSLAGQCDPNRLGGIHVMALRLGGVGNGQLHTADPPGEPVVTGAVVGRHRCSGIHAHVESVVGGEDVRQRRIDPAGAHRRAVDEQRHRSAFGQARPVVVELHPHLVRAGRDRVGGFGVEVLDATEVVAVLEFAAVGVQAPTTDVGALSDDHALGTTLRHVDLGRDRMRLVLHVEHAVLREPSHPAEQNLRITLDQHRPAGEVGVQPRVTVHPVRPEEGVS